MNDRLLTFAFAIGAFLAFYYFFVGPAQEADEESSRPLSSESRSNGYLGARLWLESQGVEVHALRHRFDWLARAGEFPKQGNLLITTIPFQRPARRGELDSLREWILQGNSVLVVAGLFDTPEWALPERDTFGDLRGVTGLYFRDPRFEEEPEDEEESEDEEDEDSGAESEETDEAAVDEGAADAEPADEAATGEDDEAGADGEDPFARLPKPKRGVLRPTGRHPLTRDVEAVWAESEFPAGKFAAVSPAGSPLLALMQDNESGFGALWLTPLGDGTVVVTGFGSIFTNKLLAQADNARLLGNTVERLLGPGGRVIFDDVHQGAASFYDAEAFFADPRLHASFWWIIALWLIWVLGGTRLPPPAAAPAPVREQAFMTATGNFFARVVDRRRIARRMLSNFFNELRRSLGLPVDGEPLWPWMRGIATLEPGLLERVEALHARVAAGRRVDLIELHNRLQQLRKQLQ